MKYIYLFALLLIHSLLVGQSITITVDTSKGRTPISPWIYGRNNNASDDPSNPVAASTWQLYNDAGLRMYRENGGNNATKYNWRLKLSSHPDWYNNVYAHDWDYSAQSILQNTKNTQAVYAFQLLGWAASNTNNNFPDYAYDQSAGANAESNWAGGGGPSFGTYVGNGGNGNPNLYLETWLADSTQGILDSWFAKQQMDSTRLMYWNMDNEPEIWQDTHDDVASSAITAEDYMQKYFAVALAVRKKFPGVKLLGPVSPNEWQWYTWNNAKVPDPKNSSITYPWMEYFIKRISEKQDSTGIRLLDEMDFHFYPGTSGDPTTTLQLHRMWYDTTWVTSVANGVKVVGPYSWNSSVDKEYFFLRVNQWLTQYMGANHGVGLGISEYGSIDEGDANVVACWYASQFGVFANNGVNHFMSWDWSPGQWEVMHLFSNYFGTTSIQATSNLDTLISGYASLSASSDSMMVVIVNRDQSNARTINLNLNNFTTPATTVNAYQLSGLPTTETFVSKSNNALATVKYTVSNNKLSFTVPSLSVTLVQIPATVQSVTGVAAAGTSSAVLVYPNPTKGKFTIQPQTLGNYIVTVLNLVGQVMVTTNQQGNGQIDMSTFPSGTYILQVTQENQVTTTKIIKD